MATEILMPALSPTMTEGKIARWLKKEGDMIAAGDVLAEIETDKATMEIEAIEEGILGRILIGEGVEGVAVNTPIAIVVEDGESVPDSVASQPAAPAPQAATAPQAPASTPAAPVLDTAPEPQREWGETREITVREALRDAMAAEPRRDEDVFLLG